MSKSKITLIGIENYLNPEQSVFDQMQLPEGIDKDTLIGAIILRCQEFELLYSDPDFLITAVKVWSLKNYRTFDKWVKALDISYDPLYNYDRTEEYTDTHSGNYDRSGNSNSTVNNTESSGNTRTDNLTQTNNLTDTHDVTLTHSEKAFNDSGFVGTTQDVTDQDDRHTGTVTNTGTVSDQTTASGNTTANTYGTDTGTDEYTNIHKARLFGNIGVTTSQQMLQSELDIATWNLYEHIADLFCNEFCIMVY